MNLHHPDEMLLLEYSAGTLSDSQALCVRLHLEHCPRCRAQADAMDYLGAVVMENRQREVSLSAGLFDRIADQLDCVADIPAQPGPAVTAGLLDRLLGADFQSLPWKRQLGSVSGYDISGHFGPDKQGGQRVALHRLRAGGKAPAHTHCGEEMTLVLQGAFSDDNGVFKPWDLVVLNQAHTHEPVALPGEDCITLSVATGPVRLTGTFARLLNPFIR